MTPARLCAICATQVLAAQLYTELRSFFPQLGSSPCRCAPLDTGGVPLRTRLLRNVSRRYDAVRVLRLHALLAPRPQWHQPDCRARSEALHRTDGGGGSKGGCDCTHYCYSPTWWRVYFRALMRAVAG